MEEKLIIETDEIMKIYGEGDAVVKALDRVDMQINENEFVAIMGPSGSGKSTMMNILGCLDRPTSGRYILAGEDVSALDKKQLAEIRNKRLGFIFQSYNLLPQTTAIDNVILPLQYNHRQSLDASQQNEKAIKALEQVGLASRLYHKPHELSGGQVQRVAIARALVNEPVLILADEPTGNLDSRSSSELMQLLSRLHSQGSTIVMVTHSDEIAAYANRILHFRDGRIETDRPNGYHTHLNIESEANNAPE
ncbi:MAG: macrolide ABC transporter ATP-binding protein [Chloroflexi bacterium RBG_16_54_18]|nr:MAG: macrolide ABC transporter ATP-binding protein [Chloroflexi bacterium RBG_16_54_18]